MSRPFLKIIDGRIASKMVEVHYRSRDGARFRKAAGEIGGRKHFQATSDRLGSESHSGDLSSAIDLDCGLLLFLFRGARPQSVAPKSASDSSALVANRKLFSHSARVREFRLVARRR